MLSASSDDIMTKYFDNDDKKGYIYLFLQINKVYQYAISRFPYSAALRIHYAIFLNDYLTMFKLYQNINADGDVNLDEIKLINQ